MADVQRIISFIDAWLEESGEALLREPGAVSLLAEAGLLRDDTLQPEQVFRELLAQGWIPHGVREEVDNESRWSIPHSPTRLVSEGGRSPRHGNGGDTRQAALLQEYDICQRDIQAYEALIWQTASVFLVGAAAALALFVGSANSLLHSWDKLLSIVIVGMAASVAPAL